jgi:hypothetical protein
MHPCEPRSWRGVLDTTLCDKVCYSQSTLFSQKDRYIKMLQWEHCNLMVIEMINLVIICLFVCFNSVTIRTERDGIFKCSVSSVPFVLLHYYASLRTPFMARCTRYNIMCCNLMVIEMINLVIICLFVCFNSVTIRSCSIVRIHFIYTF